MEALKIRIFVEYLGETKPLRIDTQLKNKELIQKVLHKLNIDSEDWESFDLVFKKFNCEITRAKDLAQDDVLILKKEIISEMIFYKERTSMEDKDSSSLDETIVTNVSSENGFRDDSLEDFGNLNGEDMEEKDEEGILGEEDDKEENHTGKKIKIPIDTDDLSTEKWPDRKSLCADLKTWSAINRMKLGLDSQERINKDGTKVSIFYCSKKKEIWM